MPKLTKLSQINRSNLPEFILPVLPFTLFFPIGVMYAGIFLFILSLLFSGNYQAKWQCVRSHVLTMPILFLSLVTCLVAIFLPRFDSGFWSSFFHYQTYLFLLLFICVGSGGWQQRAMHVFYAAAVVAASLYYLALLQLLPATSPFTSYVIYSGNKSILFGILLGIAAGWMLFDLTKQHQRRWWLLAALVYVLLALFFLAKTRTGNLIFAVCVLIVLIRCVRFNWRGVLLLVGMCAALLAIWNSADILRTRLTGMVHDVQAFAQGKKVSDDGIRLEMYQITAQMIAEKPLFGHGIGSWIGEYHARATGLATGMMTTPHNDYLLYAAELGLIGLAALMWIWLRQIVVAWQLMCHQDVEHGIKLLMLTLALMLGGMFNAILRDAVFGLAFMILLAIPLAGVERKSNPS